MQERGRSFFGGPGPDDRDRLGDGRARHSNLDDSAAHQPNRLPRRGFAPHNPDGSRFGSRHEDELFERFEDDYRSGDQPADLDTGFFRDSDLTADPGPGRFDDARDDRFDDSFDDRFDDRWDTPEQLDPPPGPDDDWDDESDAHRERHTARGGRNPRPRSRHGRKVKRDEDTEGAWFIPIFSRRHRPTERPAKRPPTGRPVTGRPATGHPATHRSTSHSPPARKPGMVNPFADIQVYLVPILVAVVIVMVLVVLMFNR